MKELKVKKISETITDAATVPALLDKENVAFQALDVVNWEAYPYKPDVKFRIAHTENAILLQYRVKESSVRAKYGNDNGSVWTDSCVEFFLIPGKDDVYYNLECNCIGTVLLGAGSGRNDREHAGTEVMETIQRWSSLGREPFEERIGDTEWEVALIIPYSAFFKHQITSLDGRDIRANFYKCGDELKTPHFVSWNPIGVENPNFHLPEYFGMIHFE
ncbi:carbohydrate-binding family 9-like protein [Bacteroides sp. 519]|uniref:carbohydrate-binding family 9-like protein n=1 Tax=Bacteroides sp. 519 TaxID=2302937 RepID=UPI0013D63C65|nr:carbohydrate-binding family 9-like protein [Bacteroides sp. 519]NDV57414.1 hypothetical protein [Bacteroides sp. 519]